MLPRCREPDAARRAPERGRRDGAGDAVAVRARPRRRGRSTTCWVRWPSSSRLEAETAAPVRRTGRHRRTRVAFNAGTLRGARHGGTRRHGATAQDRPRRGRDADELVQRHSRPAVGPATAAAPGHPRAGRARRPGAAVPDGPHPPRGLDGAPRRDPRRHPRRLPAVATDTVVPGAPVGASAGHAGADLLQVRRRLACGLAQAEHRRPPGLLQRKGGCPKADDRNRGGSVGHRPGVRLLAVRARERDLAGGRFLRPEAVPPAHDGSLRRSGAPVAEPAHRRRTVVPRAGGAAPGLARHCHLRGGGGGGVRRGRAVRTGQRAQPRALASDDHRGGGALAVVAGGGDRSRPAGRVHRWRVELRGALVPVLAREAGRKDGPGDPGGRTGLVPVAHAWRLRLRLRGHGRERRP